MSAEGFAILLQVIAQDVKQAYCSPDDKKCRPPNLPYHNNTTIMDRYNIAQHLSIVENINEADFEVVAIRAHKRVQVDNLFEGIINRGKQEVLFHTVIAQLYWNRATNKIEYIAIGPSYSSADGEYRSGFVQYNGFINLFTEEVNTALLPVYDYLTTHLQTGNYMLDYYPDHPSRAFQKAINRTNPMTKAMVTSLIYTSASEENQFIGNNTSDGYRDVLFDDELNALLTNTKNGELIRIKEWINYNLGGLTLQLKDSAHVDTTGKLGIKTIPLTLYEIENIGNPLIGNWRELYIAKRINPLVMNFIVRGLPLTGSWTMLKNYDPELFNNAAQKRKYEFSKTISHTIQQLEAARGDLYGWDDESGEEIYISAKLESLNEHIQVPINYARIYMQYSDTSLAVLTEYCGYTFGNIADIVSRIDLPRGNPLIKSDTFDRYMFEICYNLYVLNTRLGVIHTDLHLNNICFKARGTRVSPAEGVIYTANKRNYLLGNDTHYYPCIIDFSRGMITTEALSSTDTSIDAVLQDYYGRIRGIYAHTFPEFYESFRAKLDMLMVERFSDVYILLQAIDLHRFCVSFRSMLEVIVADNPSFIDAEMLTSHAYNMLNYIIAETEKQLTFGLRTLYETKYLYVKENINLRILEHLFSKYQKETVISQGYEWFRDTNNIAFDLDYKSMPNSTKYEYLLEKGVISMQNNPIERQRYTDHLSHLKRINALKDTGHNQAIQQKVIDQRNKELSEYRKSAKKYTPEELEIARQHYYDG